MTREEAINGWVKPAIKNTWNEKKCAEIIEALEQEAFMNKPCVAHQICHEDKVKVLDKIKTEINAMPTDYCGGYIGLDKQEVLQVIDKYKAEGSGEE